MTSANPLKPNIILILSDDQGSWAMGCAGNPEIRTPCLDHLAMTGLRFENFFCASPVCSPARATILTGSIPSQHGIHDWLRTGNSLIESERGGILIEYLLGQPTYTDYLSRAGYICGISGKWHLGDSHHTQKGFTFWEVHATGGGPYFNAPLIHNGQVYTEPQYVTDAITNNAITFLEQQERNIYPFYLSVHYTAPHSPWGREDHPVDIYDDYQKNCSFTSIPLEPMHPWQINSAPYGYNENSRRPILSGYFTAVTAMDRAVGRLLEWLENHGLRKNTLVIFTSDNGMNMGHHGIFGKGNGTFPANMYDTSVKVPFLVSRPGSVPENRIIEQPLSHYDILPTLLDYVRLDNPQTGQLPGRSFAPILQGQPILDPVPVVVYDEYGPTRMIRTQQWKYIHRYPSGPNELYNLYQDPGEKNNLVGNNIYLPLMENLRIRLEDWFKRYSNPQVDGTRQVVTGKGQYGLVDQAGMGSQSFAADWHYLKDEPGI